VLQLQSANAAGRTRTVLIVDPLSANRRAHYIGWPPGDRTVKTSRSFHVNVTGCIDGEQVDETLKGANKGKKPIAIIGKPDYTPLNC